MAGLRAAIELAAAGRVLVLAKKEVPIPRTGAQAMPHLSDEDEISLHLQDTLTAGDGLCNLAAVKTLIDEAPACIEELIAWGKHFDRGEPSWSLGRESHTAAAAVCMRKASLPGRRFFEHSLRKRTP